MARVNIAEFKARISFFVRLLKSGESVTLCERNVPIAEIQPVRKRAVGKRVLGRHRGKFKVPDDVWKPLSPEELQEIFGDAFN